MGAHEPPYLLHHLLERSVARCAEEEALVAGAQRFSYGELAAVARTIAGRAREQGLERGERVGIHLAKSFHESAAIFGISMAGGVFVPINPVLRPGQVRHIVADCGIRFLITDSAHWRDLGGALDATTTLERVLLVDAAEAADDARLVSGAFDGPPRAAPPNRAIGEDLAAILYTSGSTGPPRGVMLSHRNLLAGSRIVASYIGIRPEDRILSILPFSFDYGLNQLITAVEQGATTVLLTFRFGDEIVAALEAERITGLAGVPSVWALLTRAAPRFRKTPLPHLRYVTSSGGAIPRVTIQRLRETLPHVQLVLMYGLTEAFRSTWLPPEEVDARPTSIGRAIPETEVFLVDEHDRPCAPGEVGILVHRGPTVSLGYWGRPAETAAVIRPHPFIPEEQGGGLVCYSGDLARQDAEGYFTFVGRNDAMIKCTGYRVSPTEVEDVLMQAGGLQQAAVIGLPDRAAGERVHAIVVPAAGEELDTEALLAHCARELPHYMVPRSIEAADELPRSPNGKVDYPRLRAERLERREHP